MKDLPSFDVMVNMSSDQLQTLQNVMINDVIDSASSKLRSRLEGLQFKINIENRLHSTPISRCIALSKLMKSSLIDLNNALHGSVPILGSNEESAIILPFRK